MRERVPLFEEYRLIEKCETEINGAWKGAHLLLFFLAFVFGSFCTFCFHMLMYLFDEKCILFPKLLSLRSLKMNINEFLPSSKEIEDMPVDFISTQWVDKSMCSLPTYVPLVSGIFGLVWTTMFLMCSTGSRTLTGLQRPWRILPPVFVFSLAMGSLCIYSSVITHAGLQDLCHKLSEITGSPTCSYTVNVATLVYERRIRGVYQATQLTILSAWLHTACWLLSALLALVRVILAVDFLLVRISAELHGSIDKIMEKNEVQIRTVLPDTWMNIERECASALNIPSVEPRKSYESGFEELMEKGGDLLYLAKTKMETSELSLIPEEMKKIALKDAIERVPKDKAFIVKWLFDLVYYLPVSSDTQLERATSAVSLVVSDGSVTTIMRQLGQDNIKIMDSKLRDTDTDEVSLPPEKVDSIIIHHAQKKKKDSLKITDQSSPEASTSRAPRQDESIMHLTAEMRKIINKAKKRKEKKSNLKTVGVQTGDKDKDKKRVHILEANIVRIASSDDEYDIVTTPKSTDIEKETQTRKKEKQD